MIAKYTKSLLCVVKNSLSVCLPKNFLWLFAAGYTLCVAFNIILLFYISAIIFDVNIDDSKRAIFSVMGAVVIDIY